MTIIRPFSKYASRSSVEEDVFTSALKYMKLGAGEISTMSGPEDVKGDIEAELATIKDWSAKKELLEDVMDTYRGTDLEGWADNRMDDMYYQELQEAAMKKLEEVLGPEKYEQITEVFDLDEFADPIAKAMWADKDVDEAAWQVEKEIEEKVMPIIQEELKQQREDDELTNTIRFMKSPEDVREESEIWQLTDPSELEQMPESARASDGSEKMKKQASKGAHLMSTILSFTEALAQMYQHMHWKSSGPNYYGDHLLYERLYGSVGGETDAIAEKTVGVFGEDSIAPNKNSEEIALIVKRLVSDDDSADEFPNKAIAAEKTFTELVSKALGEMKDAGDSTDGIDNMLQGIVDTHEGHLYLLQQRAGKKESSMLAQLYKFAYDLDHKGLYQEAKEIEEVMQALSQRVGLGREDMIALADHFDEIGDPDLADYFDELAKQTTKDK